MCTMIGMGNAGELAHDDVSGKRGKYTRSIGLGVYDVYVCCVREYVALMIAWFFFFSMYNSVGVCKLFVLTV